MKNLLGNIAASCVAVLAATSSLAQMPPENERGFKPDSVYQLNGIDTVNLFNGNLNLAIELASYPVASDVSYSFKLQYSGNLWETHERCQDDGSCTTRVTPQNDNGGLGWRIAQEEIFAATPNSEVGSAGSLWRYQSGDGGDHYLFDTLHEPKCSVSVPSNCDLAISGVRYTRDGSYIRMTDSGTAKVLEFPSGARRRFALNAEGNWSLQYIYGASSLLNANGEPVTNWAKFEYVPSGTYSGVLDWHVTDSHGRSHWIYFQPGPGIMPDVVDKLVLAAFRRIPEDASDAAATATYDVTYDAYTFDGSGHPVDGPTSQLRRPCTATGQSLYAPVRLLRRIDLPTGESWELAYNQPTDCDDSTGTLIEAILPTRGRLRWTYQNYQFSDVDLSTGVWERRMEEPDGTVAGYTRYTIASPLALQSTTVENYDQSVGQWRLDSKVVNYFNRQSGPLLGLPFAPGTSDGTSTARNLSTETYDCSPQSNTCSASPEARSYVKYEIDYVNVNASQGCKSTDPCAKERNRRLLSDRTVYVSDGSRYADVDRWNFDGLGNYRYITTSGTFASGNSRQTYTGFNTNTRGFDATTWSGTSVGTYSLNSNGTRAPGFTMLDSTDSWILGTFTNSFVAEGATSAHAQACFNPKTGFMHRKLLLLREDGQAGPNDFLEVLTRDSSTGYASRVETFGGDHQTLCNSEVCSEPLCTMPLPSHNAYTSRTDYSFQYGALKTSRAVDGATGVNMPFFIAEREIDPNTGLARSMKDPSGLATTYSYDRGRRLTRVLAPNSIATDYTYPPATDSSAPSVSAVAQSGSLRTENVWIFDRFGRVTLEKQLLPDNVWAARQVTYDGAGRLASVSEQEEMTGTTFNPARKTLYTNYDVFGRVGSVTAPDAKVSTFSYLGGRMTTRTYNVATPAGNQNVSVTEERDRAGRLINVSENATGTPVITDYIYDVGSRVASVKVRGTSQPARTFAYDRRGMLASETHPESGTASYTYDSRGLTITKTTPVATLTNEYDAAGRVRRVLDGANELKFFQYDRANNISTGDYSLGKVATALRHNRDTSLGSDVTVLETFFYKNPEGRMSGKQTTVSTGETFDQSYAYDPLGRLSTLSYPTCSGCSQLTEPSRTVSFSYDADRVEAVGVPGDAGRYADNIKFHADGLVREIRHRNAGGGLGPLFEQTLKDGMARPELIKVSQFCDGFTFTTAPQPRTVIAGQAAGVTATASGATSYEWYKRVGTTDTLVLTQMTPAPLPTIVNTTTMFWVRAKNGTCSIDSAAVTVTVAGDMPPVANFNYSCAGRTCNFDASSSTDDIGITSYQWNFGDATTGTGQAPGHTYAGTALSFTVTLTVTDTIGQTNQTQRNVPLDAIAATLTYTGAIEAEISVPFSVSAQLTRTSTGAAISGQPIVFTLGAQSTTATTNSSGNALASITPTNSGNLSLSVSFAGGGGYAAAQDSDPVYVAPRATVTGVVRNAVTSSAVSGATVQLLGGNATTTIASGVYSLSTQSGVYTLSAAKTGYATVNQTVTVPAGQVVSRDVSLPVTTALFYNGPTTGAVQTPLTLTASLTEGLGGSVLSGRLVSFQLGSQSASGTTNGGGIASVSITPNAGGNVPLQVSFASAGGYDASQTNTTLSIASGGTVQGVISSAVTGAAISGATVGLTGGGSTSTNAAGQYSISTPAGSYTLNTTKVGYVTAATPVTVGAGQTVTTNVNLVATTSLSYSGATTGEINVPLAATARLMDNVSNTPIAGRLIGFTLNGVQFTTATTDANGFATVTLTPTGSGSQPVVATFGAFGGWAGSQVTAQVAVAAAATVSGTIRNAVTLAPISAASITLSTGASTTTNASGQYTASTRSGSVTLNASKTNYATGSVTVSVAPGGSVTGNFDLLVLPAIANNSPSSGEVGVPLTLSATVTNSLTGVPLTARPVTFTLGSQSTPGTTSVSGVAMAMITPAVSGTIPLTVSIAAANGYAAGQFNGSIVIAPASVVTGTVRNAATSLPISGVTMALTTGETTTTNASGQYSLSFHSGTNTLTATKAGYVTGSMTGSLPPGQTVTADFSLQVTTVITYTGPTSGEINVPLTLTARLNENAAGTVLTARSLTFTLGSQSATGTTNVAGVASVMMTPSASGPQNLTIGFAAAGGYEAAQSTSSIPIATAASLSGIVRNAVTSGPIAGATVAIAGIGSTTTNASGTYTFSMRSGTYSVAASQTNYETGSANNVTLTPGQSGTADFNLAVSVTLAYSGPLTGEINVPFVASAHLNDNVTGLPLSGKVVTFVLGAQTLGGTTNVDGFATATLTPFHDGNVTLQCSTAAGGGYAASPRITVPMEIAEEPTIIGYARNAVTNVVIGGATVTLSNGATTTTAASGQFAFGVRSGSYVVTVAKAGYVAASASVTLAPGDVHLMDIALTPSTSIAYTGAMESEPQVTLVLTARLTEDIGNTPLVGATLTFAFDGTTTNAATDVNGVASATVTPLNLGSQTLTIAYAGASTYGPRQITKSIRIGRPSTLYVSGKSSLSLDYPESVSAVLKDVNGAALAGRTLTFTIGAVSASATTDATGEATATITPPGPSAQTQLTVSFAGETSNLSRTTSMPVVTYEMTQFSIWGGNDTKPVVGNELVFAGDTWMGQVNSGDYAADPFNGYFLEGILPLTLCQADYSSISEPPLDDTCLKVPNPDPSLPPGTIQLYPYPQLTSAYIAVAVPTSIVTRAPFIKRGIVIVPGATYGNVAAVAVIEVTAYDPDTGGSGIIRDIVADGQQLFGTLRYSGPSTLVRETPVPLTVRLVTTQDRIALANKTVSFTIGAVTMTATTKPDGTATVTMTLPSTESAGARSLTIAFAGDAGEPASATTVPVNVQ